MVGWVARHLTGGRASDMKKSRGRQRHPVSAECSRSKTAHRRGRRLSSAAGLVLHPGSLQVSVLQKRALLVRVAPWRVQVKASTGYLPVGIVLARGSCRS